MLQILYLILPMVHNHFDISMTYSLFSIILFSSSIMSESNGVEALEGSSSLPQASSTSSSSPLASTDAVSKAVDACQRGNLEVLEQLLFTGLSPNIVDQVRICNFPKDNEILGIDKYHG